MHTPKHRGMAVNIQNSNTKLQIIFLNWKKTNQKKHSKVKNTQKKLHHHICSFIPVLTLKGHNKNNFKKIGIDHKWKNMKQLNPTPLNQFNQILKQNMAAPVCQDVAHTKKLWILEEKSSHQNATYHLWAELAQSQAMTSVSAAAGSECC